MKRTLYCSNCGKYCHNYKSCLDPITSYGVILYKIDDDLIKYLLIRRKDTLSYVEFIRGRYNNDNKDYIFKLLQGMTETEHNKILQHDFNTLWDMLWISPTLKQHKKELAIASEKFNENQDIIRDYIMNNKTQWINPEWGFPKGRRHFYETDLDCAEREFIEETGIKKDDYIILKHIKPITEVFYGSNNIKYKHVYYIGLYISDDNISIDTSNKHQVAEVGDIGWYSYLESLDLIRPYNIEKKKALTRSNDIIKRLCIKNFD